MKRKKKYAFPRNTILTATVHAPKAGNYTCTGNINSGEFKILDETGNILPIEKVCITQSRSRESAAKKGPQKICEIFYTGPLSLSLNEVLLNFNHVYAVDTNTKHIGDSWLSVGCICYLADCQKNGAQYTYKLKLVRQITSTNSFLRYQMEQHVWNAAISYIQSVVPANNTVALIVDCDLGNISKYNERSLKIRDAAYLPENFTLVYASADTGDTIANAMISFCDSCANIILNKLASSKSKEKKVADNFVRR